ncbi:MAG: hypothetical protein ABIO02_03925 [Patescibacteria group bacterium]
MQEMKERQPDHGNLHSIQEDLSSRSDLLSQNEPIKSGPPEFDTVDEMFQYYASLENRLEVPTEPVFTDERQIQEIDAPTGYTKWLGEITQKTADQKKRINTGFQRVRDWATSIPKPTESKGHRNLVRGLKTTLAAGLLFIAGGSAFNAPSAHAAGEQNNVPAITSQENKQEPVQHLFPPEIRLTRADERADAPFVWPSSTDGSGDGDKDKAENSFIDSHIGVTETFASTVHTDLNMNVMHEFSSTSAEIMALVGEEVQPVDAATRKTLVDLATTLEAKKGIKFSETGQTLIGLFAEYWAKHGGLAQQGFPISDMFVDISSDGKPYVIQYFERAVFEYHPEFAPPNNVQLSLLGVAAKNRDFPISKEFPQGKPVPPIAEAKLASFKSLGQTEQSKKGHTFTETNHAVGGPFLDYWLANGGLAQQGFPITEPTTINNPDEGELVIQYFERAVFEYHKDYPDPYKVSLSLLGNEEFDRKFIVNPQTGKLSRRLPGQVGGGTGGQVSPTVAPTPEVTPSATPKPENITVKIPGKEYLGGYTMGWEYNNGTKVGWEIPDKGKVDLMNNILRVMGANEDSIKARPTDLVNFKALVYDTRVSSNYRERAPSLVTGKDEQWNPSLPIVFTQDEKLVPIDYRIRTSDSRFWYAVLTGPNKELIIATNKKNDPSLADSLSVGLNMVMEGMGRTDEADSLPKLPHGEGDLMKILIGKFGSNFDPNYDYKTVPGDFFDYNTKYKMFGANP